MRAVQISFLHMLKFIRRDMMLFAACLAPLLAGTAIKFLIPFMESILTDRMNMDVFLSPYYGLFDLFFASIAPTMFCFIAAMVVLEEHDDHIESYLFVTGLGKSGYFLSRIFMPSFCAFVVTMALLPIFRLTGLSAAMMICLSLTGTLQGIIIALLIVTLSSNKLEGMAVTKISTLIILGALVPYFVSYPMGYVFILFPSFWMGKSICENNVCYMFPAILTASVWIMILLKKFRRKLI